MLDPQQIKQLRGIVLKHYKQHARHDLPWRKTSDAYHILVSEVMLQQTQVNRVIEKYTSFIARFPTLRTLADAPLAEVLSAWQGLGYNRRAKMLHTCARVVVAEHGGILPRDYRALLSLPGIGPYTAGAVCAFAYDIPIPVLETNIRTVLFHHFFGTRTAVPDAELMEMSAQLLTGISPRTWYYALMDYGSFLKAQGVRLNSKSKHYTKQSRFEGSDRQVRGAILRCLTKRRAVREPMVVQAVGGAPARVRTQLRALAREGLVRREGGRWTI